jgi:hypothetical protein
MPQNKHSFKNSLLMVIIAYQTKLNISRKKRATKILPKRLHIVILNYLCNAIKKTLGENSLHRHFKKIIFHKYAINISCLWVVSRGITADHLTRGYIVILNYLCNAIKKTFREISLPAVYIPLWQYAAQIS